MPTDFCTWTIPTLIPQPKRIPGAALLASLLVLSGCSHHLTRSKAAELLQKTTDCAKPISMELNLGGIAYAGTNMGVYEGMQRAGYLKVNGPMFGGASYYTYTVLLTAAGEDAMRKYGWTLGPKETRCAFRASCPPPQPQKLDIPVAACKISEVTGVVKEGNKATVDFVQIAEPNEFMKSLAKKLGQSDEPRKESGRREFTLYDDGWRVAPPS